MSHQLGDDAPLVYPVIDPTGGTIAQAATVVAHHIDGDDVACPAEWATATALLPDSDATFRDISIQLTNLRAGIWAFWLDVPAGKNLFLGNEVILE